METELIRSKQTMHHWEYAKEPFDLKLFVYLSVKGIGRILLGACLGLLIIGGGYYLRYIVLAPPAPYQVVDKYYVEYGTDPQILNTYSYFAGYTWDDWIKSDEWVAPVLERLPFSMTKEELTACLAAEIKSDVRIPYITVTHPEKEKAWEIAEAYRQSMYDFGKSQKELIEIRLMDTEGPAPESRDIRVFRACVLGIVVGAFVAWFLIGLFYLMNDRVYLPEQFTYRYGLPTAGYLSKQNKPSDELGANLTYLLKEKETIGVTAVCGKCDLEVTGLLEKICAGKQWNYFENPFSEQDKLQRLRAQKSIVLLVRAGRDEGGAIRSCLHNLSIQELQPTAVVLTDADESLLAYYRFPAGRNAK